MTLPEELIPVGYIVRTHGFKGEVILSFHSPLSGFPSKGFVFFNLEGRPVPFLMEKVSGPADYKILKLEDVTSEMQAKALVGAQAFLENKNSIVEEYFPEAVNGLIGFQVVDKNLGSLGVITDVLDSSGKKILVILHQGKEVLIPAEKPILVRTSKVKKEVTVNLPEGLLDIYLS